MRLDEKTKERIAVGASITAPASPPWSITVYANNDRNPAEREGDGKNGSFRTNRQSRGERRITYYYLSEGIPWLRARSS